MDEYKRIQLWANARKGLFIIGVLALLVGLVFVITNKPSQTIANPSQRVFIVLIAAKLIQAASGLAIYAILVFQGFRSGIKWGLPILLLPIVGLIFACFHPDRAKWAIRIFVFNIVLYVIVILALALTGNVETR